jgi:hypothetical protein
VFDKKKLFDELGMQELYDLCPDDKARTELLKSRIELYADVRNFSPELLEFCKVSGVSVGAGLRKGSPIQLQAETKQGNTKMAKKEAEKEPNYTLIGGLSVMLPEAAERLEENGTVTLTWDGDALNFGMVEKAPAAKAAKKPKEEPEEEAEEEEAPKKGKKAAAAAPKKSKGPSQKDFMALYEAKDDDGLTEFAAENELEFEESPNASVNRVRIKKVAFAKFGWE